MEMKKNEKKSSNVLQWLQKSLKIIKNQCQNISLIVEVGLVNIDFDTKNNNFDVSYGWNSSSGSYELS